MQFKVPQFLEIEDKIFGPFTFREFVYLVGGAGMCFVVYKALGLLFGFIPILIIAAFALALTFYRPNSKPFLDMLESFFKYIVQGKLYIWKRRENKTSTREITEKTKLQNRPAGAHRLSGSKLRDLAWSLDVLDARKQTNNSYSQKEDIIQ